jgi:hypothetical protein
MRKLKTEEVLDILQARFQIDAVRLSLHRTATGQLYEGSGIIRSQADGGFEFRLYDRDTRHADIPTTLLPAGRILGLDDLYEIIAQDSRGRHWKAGGINPSYHVNSNTPGVLWYGSVYDLRFSYALRGQYKGHSEMFFADGLKLPETRWTIPLRNPKVVVSKTEGGTRVVAKSKEPLLPRGWDSRIEESLWFALGQTAWWVVKTEIADGEYSVRLRSRTKHADLIDSAPLRLRSKQSARHLGRIAARYYKYVSRADTPNHHPLSVNVARVLHARATAVEMEASELGVAVEALVRRELQGRMRVSRKLRKEVEDLKEHMERWPTRRKTSAKVLERALSAVGQIPTPSVYWVLSKLSESGRVAPEHPRAWRSLRNTATHGDIELDEALFNLVEKVRVLFTLLVFHVVGYRGPFTDRSADTSTDRLYPLSENGGKHGV